VIGFRAVILRLGSGEAAHRGCGPKAALLDRAAHAGLPVPPGVLVLDEAWRSALERGLVRVAGVRSRRPVSVPDPSLLVHLIGLPSFGGPLAVRSAFSGEDGASESLAGVFVSGLFVDGRRPAALAAGLAGVWASAFRRPRGFRRDLIIQEMVHARRAGVAFTEREYEDDIVNATEGTAECLVGGRLPGEQLLLPKRRGPERPTAADPAEARLQILLRDVRRVFDEGDWDVEWADDGEHIWLVQVRPVTRPTRRNELFTSAGHRELLPDPPSRLMTSLIASCSPRLFDFFRRLDARLPAGRPLVEVFRGRPFLNLSLLTETLRRWGLPTRLVTDSSGGAADRDFGARPLRLLLQTPLLVRLAAAQLRSVSSAAAAEQRILERTASPPASLAEAAEELEWLYSMFVAQMLSLSTAMSGPLALLRRAGVLVEVAPRWRSAGTELREDLAALRARAAGRPDLLTALGRGALPEDEPFRRAFDAWLERHGHRGVHEGDIASPRYRENPETVLRSLATPAEPLLPPPPISLRASLLRPVAWQAERTLRARERLRSTALRGFERVRAFLLVRARRLHDEGVLPSADAVFRLDLDELQRLDEGFRPDAAFWRARASEERALGGYEFPDVFHRLDDLESFRPGSAGGMTPPARLRGIGLTTGQARGRAWVLTKPSIEPPAGFRAAETILVAGAVNAAWIPTFGRVAGVAVEVGGDLSHGSITLREMGLPAVTNVRGATHAFRTGDELILRADEGTVERVEPGL
jgi:phosphohistidine swiveling domain-containing protein